MRMCTQYFHAIITYLKKVKMSKFSIESLFKKGLKELSLPVRSEQVKAFMTYLEELKRWNRAYNLTSIRKDEDIIIKHFLDSLLYLKALPEGKIVVMDVGSGAGFPGIPLKIVRPEIRLFLVEPSRKKAGFLMHMVKTLRLEDVEVIEKRIEDVSGLKVDVALTRALFDIGDFYKKAYHLLKEGGRLILSKGPKFEEETKEIKGNLNFEILKLRLPLKDICRYIVIVYPLVESDKTVKIPESSEQQRPKGTKDGNICFNIDCRLRKAGCKGFEGCPGFKTRA